MYKKCLAYKLLSFFSLLNLSLQPFFNFLLISAPAFVLAQEQIEAGITFDKSKNSFNLTVNKQGEIHYELFYRTDSKIENVSGTSKNSGENFSQEIYAGTCSSGGVCTPHQVLRGILKIEVKSEGWLSSKRFTVDNGNLNLVEESASSGLNLTDEENSWLENPDQQQIEKECLTNQSFVDTKDEDWQVDKEKETAETKEKVKLGVKYIFPLEDKVSVSFKCLPKEGATPLKIQKVKISDLNLPEGVNPYGEWAYDITTGMQDGTFEYEMTLPKPEGEEAKVIYIEKSLEEMEEGLEAEEIKEVGEDKVEQKEDEEKVEVKGLDHFTVYFVETTEKIVQEKSAPIKLSLPPLSYNSSDTYVLTSVTGIWTSVTDGGDTVTGLNTNEVRWGDPEYSGGKKSGLRFDGTGQQSFNEGSNFLLGALTHFNYPIYNAATGAKLKITLTFSQPAVSPNPDFTYDFEIEETTNSWSLSQCPIWQESNTPCDDKITFPSSYGEKSFQIGDKLYTLKIQGFVNSWPGGSPVSYFITGENKDNTAYLVGTLSSVLVPAPQISLVEKAVNGEDADSAPGPTLYVGDTATFTYSVQNTGNVGLTNIVVNDDNGTPSNANDDFFVVCSGISLDPGGQTTCTTTKPVVAGQYTNTAYATGVHSSTTYTSNTELANYYGVSKGTIIIVKDADPNNSQDFNFTGSLGNFDLDDDSDPTLLNTKTFSNITPGTYTVTEPSVSGWDLTNVVCDDTNSTGDVNNRNAVIQLDPGETVTCTFTNTMYGSITVQKNVDLNGDGDILDAGEKNATDWTWKLNNDAGHSTNTTVGNLLPATYTVSETQKDGYHVNNMSCKVTSGGATTIDYGAVASGNVVLSAGQTFVCTFTNTRDTGTIELKKVWSGTPGQTNLNIGTTVGGSEIVTVQTGASGGTQLTTGQKTVVTGPYYLSESDGLDNYTKSLSCFNDTDNDGSKDGNESTVNVDPNNDSVSVAKGNHIICSYTNTYVPYCGDGNLDDGEECDGNAGVDEGKNFCTSTCKLVPIYGREDSCPSGTVESQISSTTISSTNPNGETISLTGGKTYLFEAVGEYGYGGASKNNDIHRADAGYATKENALSAWASLDPRFGIDANATYRGVTSLLSDWGTETIGLVNWGNYNSNNHAYKKLYSAISNVNVKFVISDWYSDWYNGGVNNNQGGMGDNEGSLTLNVYECKPSATVKICKNDSNGNPLSDWQVVLREQSPAETVTVPPTGASFSSSSLPANDYILRASGYYTYRPGTAGAEYTDANFSKRAPSDSVYDGPYIPWVNVNNFPDPIKGWLGVMVNNSATNWSNVYNPDHVYALGYTNYSGAFSFKILDDNYSDNSGNIPVEIYHGWTKFTGEDGCATFENIELGNYYIEEILQDSWVNDSGIGTVNVDDAGETFTITNHKILPHCGDGVINQNSEQCDGTAGVGQNQFCTSNCKLVPIYTGSHSCSDDKTPVLKESKSISSTSSTATNVSVTSDQEYLFEVSGAYNYDKNNQAKIADAAYATGDNWFTVRSDIGIWGTNRGVTSVLADFGAGVGVVEWDNNNTPNLDNKYKLAFTPTTSSSLQFLISDWYDAWYPGSNNQGSMSDNNGDLTLNVYECENPTQISGQKFSDSNGNGTKDDSEVGLAGWTIYAAKEVNNLTVNSKDMPTVSSIALENGQKYLIRVSGTYDANDSIVADAKYSHRAPNTVWTDVVQHYESYGPSLLDLQINESSPDWGSYNSNHVYWLTYTGAGSSLNFRIYDIGNGGNNNGSLNVTIYKVLAETTTDSSGNYSLDISQALDGSIIVAEQTQGGWYQTAPSGSNFGYCSVTPYTQNTCDFGNTMVSLGSISGMKFEDVNGDGVKDTNDSGLSGWEVELYGDQSNLISSKTTDNSGEYSFTNLVPGYYQVCEVEQSDWKRTYPSGSNCQPVTVLAGEDTPNVNFGNFKLGSISGAKIYDKDDDGIQDDGEGGIEGWKIYLSSGSLKEEISTTTDSDGNYEFTGLVAGAYIVREEKRDGWRASNPESGESGSISISSGTNAKFDFFNAPPASILLTKSNNAAAPVKPGDPVEYTLTITVGERTLSEMTLIDILPNGFSYQTGTTNIATTLGGLTTTANTEPTLKRANKKLVWTWPTGIAGGSIVVVKYTVKIDAANKSSSYTNLAYVWGSGSPTIIESQIVDSVVKIEPAYAPEGKVAGGEVLSAATQTTGQIEGEVLGATLPAAGANTWFLLAAIALIGTGLALRPKKENRQKN